jgi:hypothetical protein
LEQLDRLKQGNKRLNGDAREVIAWLDDITSLPEMETTGQVQLQGMDENYATWKEVESFLLPETLLSTESQLYDVDNLDDEFDMTLQLHEASDKESLMSQSSLLDQEPTTPVSKRSSSYSQTSPGTLNASPYVMKDSLKDAQLESEAPSKGHSRNSSTMSSTSQGNHGSTIPQHLRSLYSYILWRVHEGHGLASGLDAFIFLTNDPVKRAIAQRFGIRVKNTDQLREAIRREERDDKNRQALFEKETAAKESTNQTRQQSETDTFKRSNRFGSSPHKSQQLWEPNSSEERASTNKTTSNRGQRGGRGRGSRGAGRGGSNSPAASRNTKSNTDTNGLNGPIDPDSFSRPSTGRNFRGDRRKLWNPTVPT